MSKWFQDRRQEFIGATLKTFGQIRREQLVDQFGISTQMASQDINTWMRANMGAAIYDVTAKCYVFAVLTTTQAKGGEG